MALSTEFRAGKTAILRAVARPELPVSPFPDLDDLSPWSAAARLAWLRQVWSEEDVAEALDQASPALASQVRALCSASNPAERDVRRAVASVARYVLRAEHRATPFGLFARRCLGVDWDTGTREVGSGTHSRRPGECGVADCRHRAAGGVPRAA